MSSMDTALFVIALSVLTCILALQIKETIKVKKKGKDRKKYFLGCAVCIIAYIIYISAYIINVLIFYGERADFIQESIQITLQLRILSISVFIVVRYVMKSLKRTIAYTIIGSVVYFYFRGFTGDGHLTLILTLISISILRFCEGLVKEIICKESRCLKRMFSLCFLGCFIITLCIFLLYERGIKLIYPVQIGSLLGFGILIGAILYSVKVKKLLGVMCLTVFTFVASLLVMISNESATKKFIYYSPNGKERLIAEQKVMFLGDTRLIFCRDKFFMFTESIPYVNSYQNAIYGNIIYDKGDIKVTWIDEYMVTVKINGEDWGPVINLKDNRIKYDEKLD